MSNFCRDDDRCVILMADDDDNDVFLFGRALGKSKTPHRLARVKDGFETLKYLRCEGVYGDRDTYPAPHLMILDLKMPVFDGFDVLVAVRKDNVLCKLPIVVMSGSNIDDDREKAMKLGAKAYFAKAFGLEKMVQAAEAICKEWLPNGCHGKPGYELEAA